MMKSVFFKLIVIAGALFLPHFMQAQVQKYKPASDSYIIVKGSSTIHDWEMKSEDITGEVLFKTNGKGQPEQLESISFRLKKTTLKSDKSGLNRRAYDAMNAAQYPEIIFSSEGNGSLQKNGDNYKINSSGVLTIAGKKRQVNLQATCINGEDKKLVCSGSQELKMTDFEIDPPVMMLGALRTADEVTVSYSIVYVH